MTEAVPLCPECDKPLRRNAADEHVYPWYCIARDAVYDWPDLEYAVAALALVDLQTDDETSL